MDKENTADVSAEEGDYCRSEFPPLEEFNNSAQVDDLEEDYLETDLVHHAYDEYEHSLNGTPRKEDGRHEIQQLKSDLYWVLSKLNNLEAELLLTNANVDRLEPSLLGKMQGEIGDLRMLLTKKFDELDKSQHEASKKNKKSEESLNASKNDSDEISTDESDTIQHAHKVPITATRPETLKHIDGAQSNHPDQGIHSEDGKPPEQVVFDPKWSIAKKRRIPRFKVMQILETAKTNEEEMRQTENGENLQEIKSKSALSDSDVNAVNNSDKNTTFDDKAERIDGGHTALSKKRLVEIQLINNDSRKNVQIREQTHQEMQIDQDESRLIQCDKEKKLDSQTESEELNEAKTNDNKESEKSSNTLDKEFHPLLYAFLLFLMNAFYSVLFLLAFSYLFKKC